MIRLNALFFIALQSFLLAGLAVSDPAGQAPPKPITSNTEAESQARQWIGEAKLMGLSLGETKNAGLVFVIDVIDSEEPGLHANHLIIRKDDGFTTLVYPVAGIPRLGSGKAPGLDGLAGMSGMSGMAGAAQPYRRTGIGSDMAARKNVEAWLQTNSMTGLYALEDVASMHYLFIVDLYEPKTHRLANQAIVRSTDGYVALVRPIKTASGAVPAFVPSKP